MDDNLNAYRSILKNKNNNIALKITLILHLICSGS